MWFSYSLPSHFILEYASACGMGVRITICIGLWALRRLNPIPNPNPIGGVGFEKTESGWEVIASHHFPNITLANPNPIPEVNVILSSFTLTLIQGCGFMFC